MTSPPLLTYLPCVIHIGLLQRKYDFSYQTAADHRLQRALSAANQLMHWQNWVHMQFLLPLSWLDPIQQFTIIHTRTWR